MANIWLFTLLSVFVVSAVSLIGAVTLAVNQERLRRSLLYLVSFSAGALLGDVFLHILPEIAEVRFGLKEGGYILAGLLMFFVLERYIHWQHAHGEHEESVHSAVYLTIVGDGIHNFLDGLIIAASYMVSVPVGLATTVAVVFHEIPQEIGNFAVLVHGGWSPKKALWYNFLSALTSIAGAVVALAFVQRDAEAPVFLLCLGAASFIYIALSDIVPQLHLESNAKKSGWQLLWLVLGTAVMGLLLLLE
jgi:zinc and cadmium transporter